MGPEVSQRSKRRLDRQLIHFEVEGNVYQELQYGFKKWSESAFPDMFRTSKDAVTEGTLGSAQDPIRLSDCTSSEFESLLEVMYPSDEDITPEMLKKEEWIGVLKLSRLWDMPQMSAVAIENLGSFDLSPIEKITLGKAGMYEVPAWITEAYTTIIGDSSQMSLEALASFGWETAARVLWALKEVYSKSYPLLTTSEIVEEILKEEFKPKAQDLEKPLVEPSPSTEPALDYTPLEILSPASSLRITATESQPVPGRAGIAGIIGFGQYGVYVSRDSIQAPTFAIRDFGYDVGGWRVEKHVRLVGDTTGSGLSDIIGFGDAGVYISCNLGDGTFGRPKLVLQEFGYDAGGWRVEKHVRYAVDLRKKGRVDIIGFGDAGVLVALNNGDGTFGPAQLVLPDFGHYAGNWRKARHLRFLADVTGNGIPDIIGFGESSVVVALNNGDGTFQQAKSVINDFAFVTETPWRIDTHPRTVADLTGDGRVDIIGFGNEGVYVAFNAGGGTFHPPILILEKFGRTKVKVKGKGTHERTVDSYYTRFVADLTGDGRGDFIGFNHNETIVARNNGDGTFRAPEVVQTNFTSGSGWTGSRYLVDLTGNGTADILGFRGDGVWASYNDGKGNFGPAQNLTASFLFDDGDWSSAKTVRWVTNLYG